MKKTIAFDPHVHARTHARTHARAHTQVLVALYVTEHCFGIGALFLAVPVTVFVIQALLGIYESGFFCLACPFCSPSCVHVGDLLRAFVF
jgi:hypothetical protein